MKEVIDGATADEAVVPEEQPEAPAPVEDVSPVPQANAGDVVAYVGTDNWRSILEEHWLAIDITGKDRMWDESDRWEIPVADFSDGELAWLATQDDFAVREATPVLKATLVITPDPAQHFDE